MRQKIKAVFGITVCLMLAYATFVFSQEPPANETSGLELEPDIQWLWGEAVSVDTQKSELSVKYLDYDTEQEKEMTVAVDDKTTYENIKSLAEIKLKDTLSIDYAVGLEGKNIAKNISLEKPESPEAQGVEAPSVETVPSDLEPSGKTE